MNGVLIAGMGLPGSGKSSVFGALADLLIRDGSDANLYREPEEEFWPHAVSKREEVGYITALTWFRSQRVPGLYAAASDRAAGKIALVDSYYDKLIANYFSNSGFEWLMNANDPYREAYKQIISLDRQLLPDADCIVTFIVEEQRWKSLVLGRGRMLDRTARILDGYATQGAFIEVSENYCTERGIPHIKFENSHQDKLASAQALHACLKAVNVL